MTKSPPCICHPGASGAEIVEHANVTRPNAARLLASTLTTRSGTPPSMSSEFQPIKAKAPSSDDGDPNCHWGPGASWVMYKRMLILSRIRLFGGCQWSKERALRPVINGRARLTPDEIAADAAAHAPH